MAPNLPAGEGLQQRISELQQLMDEKDLQALAVVLQWQESYEFLQKENSELLAQIEASQQLPSVTEAQSEGDQQSPGLEERCCETELELAKYREASRMYPMRNLCLK